MARAAKKPSKYKAGDERARYRGKRVDAVAQASPEEATCGAAGGVTDNSAPCVLPAGFGTDRTTGRCMYHNDVAAEQQARAKTIFLEEYKKGVSSIGLAASKAGVTTVTIWRWRQADRNFDKAFIAARQSSDGLRVAIVEDSQFFRIVKGEHHAAESIFFLKNRGSDRWKDRHDVGVSGDLLVNIDDVRQELANRLARRANANGDQRATRRA